MYDCSYTNQLLIQHEFLISYNHNTCKSKKNMSMQECLYRPKDNAWTNWTAVGTDRISSFVAEMIAITGYLQKQMHWYPAPWFQYLNVSSYQRLVSHDCVFILLFWDSRLLNRDWSVGPIQWNKLVVLLNWSTTHFLTASLVGFFRGVQYKA